MSSARPGYCSRNRCSCLRFTAGALDHFQIRVGNVSSQVGKRDTFTDNALCAFSLPVDTDDVGSIQFDCTKPLIGRYVSIKHVDPVFFSQMKLCNVTVLYRWRYIQCLNCHTTVCRRKLQVMNLVMLCFIQDILLNACELYCVTVNNCTGHKVTKINAHSSNKTKWLQRSLVTDYTHVITPDLQSLV